MFGYLVNCSILIFCVFQCQETTTDQNQNQDSVVKIFGSHESMNMNTNTAKKNIKANMSLLARYKRLNESLNISQNISEIFK